MSHHDTIMLENQLPISELLDRAAQGDNECRYWAGIRYFLADGLPKDDEEGYRLCLAAAEQGHRRAQAFVGYFYSRGIVVPYRPRLSIKWYRLSAEQGYAAAQYSLATFYLYGKGVKKNIRLAIKWLELAAAQEYLDALIKLGHLYNDGENIEQDLKKAFCYFLAAARQEDAAAQYCVARMLDEGIVTENRIDAFYWLDRSAAQGYWPAVTTVGRCAKFVLFDPEQENFGHLPISHPVPVRVRTLITMEYLERPCLEQMVKDIHDYILLHPQTRDRGDRDIALLLEAISHQGGCSTVPNLS